MTEAEKAICVEWVKAHAHKWQVMNRAKCKFKFRESTLVRYVDEVQCRESEINLLLEYLASDECIATLSAYDQSVSGNWKPTRAWLEPNNKAVNGVRAVRLCHGLATDLDDVDDGPYTVENGCAAKVTHTYYWRAPSKPSAPASSSGVTYKIVGLTRDQDSGLYSYVLEKRERVQQDVPEYLAAITSFESVKKEEHIGVKAANVSKTGKQAASGGGVMVRRRLTKNDDCTTNVDNDTVTEIARESSTTEKSEGVKSSATTTVNRNMPDKAKDTNLAIGTSVRNELTDGGRWNQTIRTVTAKKGVKTGVGCKRTVYEHRDSVEAVTDDADAASPHAENAGGGKTTSVSFRRGEDGIWEKATETKQELPQARSVVVVEKSVDGVTETVTDRNQQNAGSSASLGVGESVRSEMTEGGLWDVTRRIVNTEGAGTTAADCRQTALEHTHTTRTNEGADPGSVEQGQAGNGIIYEMAKSQTQKGSWDVTRTTRTAKERSATTNGGSVGRTVETKSVRNAQSIDATAGGQNEEVDTSAHVNEFGLLDGTVRKTVYAESVAESQSATALWTETEEVKHNATSVPSGDAADGKTVQVSATPNEHGSFSTRKVTRTAKPHIKEVAWSEDDGNYAYNNKLITFRNQTEIPSVENGCAHTSVSVSINEFGLYDGVIHTKTKSGGGGHQSSSTWDDRVDGVITKRFMKDGAMYYQRYTYKLRLICNTWKEMTTQAARGERHPELGLMSGVYGGVAYVYSDVKKDGSPTKES